MEIELLRSQGLRCILTMAARQNVFSPEKKPQIKELQMHADLITIRLLLTNKAEKLRLNFRCDLSRAQSAI